MQIGIEVSALGSKNTGTGRYIECLLNSLQNSGSTVIPFSPRQNIISNVFKKAGKSGIYRNFYRHFFLGEEMNKHNLDCAIFPDYIIPPGFNKKSVVVIHDLSFISHPHFYPKYFVKYYTRQLKESLNKNPIIAVVSNCTKSAVVKLLNVKEENVILLQPYKSNLSSSNKIFEPGLKPYLLYVGHIEPRKNLYFLIENFLRWKKENHIDIKLILAGEIWIKSAEIKLMLEEYYAHPEIEFKGYTAQGELDSLYVNASGFVHTSFVEGFGFPVLDAMHFNLPIICTENTASDEITNGQSVTINPYKEGSLLKAFNKLYENITEKKPRKYLIKYSESLMSEQLGIILNRLEIRNGFYTQTSIPVIKDLEKAVEKTLIYSSIFNSGISENKMHKFLFDVRTSASELSRTLLCMENDKKIIRKNGQFFLNNGTYSEYYGKRKLSGRKKREKLLKFLNRIPFVSAIAFSGGSAHYGEDHDDIDLFIITKPDAVYIVYFLVHAGSLLFKARSEICANYLIDEKELEINYQKDIYTAHQIASLIPFKNKNLLDYFISKNSWIKKYFPNLIIDNSFEKKSSIFYLMLKPANKIIKFFYRIFYRKLLKQFSGTGSLRIDDNILKLHTNDNHSAIMNCFSELLKNYYKKEKMSLTIDENFIIEKKTAVNF